MERHPGKGRPLEAPPLSIPQCADLADQMYSELVKRWPFHLEQDNASDH